MAAPLRSRTPRLTAARGSAAGYVALAVIDTALAASASPQRRRLRRITKPLLMPTLGTAFSSSLASRDLNRGGILRGGTVAAQALSGVGDIALLGGTRAAFLTGLTSFLGAHVAYTAAFASTRGPTAHRPATTPATGVEEPPRQRSRRSRVLREWAGVGVAAGAFAIVGPSVSSRAGRENPALRAPVLAYTGAITAMFAAATRLDPTVTPSARRKVVVGSTLFVGSDTILAVREFVISEPPPWTGAAVMATYTLGQGLIAAGVAEAVQGLAAQAATPA